VNVIQEIIKMVTLTRPQRVALKVIYDRGQNSPNSGQAWQGTYREFRRTVQPELCGPAVMVPWCGMWLGIEKDGHTHS
jgi:hypothetical protein